MKFLISICSLVCVLSTEYSVVLSVFYFCGHPSLCCEVPLRKSYTYVSSTWQTSPDYTASVNCFQTRDSLAESAAAGSYRYFQTAANEDNLHWFAVNFAKSLPIASVSIFSDGDGAAARLLHEKIEVWITDSNRVDLGVDHCTAAPRAIRRLFLEADFNMTACDIVKKSFYSLPGSKYKSNSRAVYACRPNAQMRTLVLLKVNSRPMGFSDLLLQLRSVEETCTVTTSDGQPKQQMQMTTRFFVTIILIITAGLITVVAGFGALLRIRNKSRVLSVQANASANTAEQQDSSIELCASTSLSVEAYADVYYEE